MKRFKKLGSFLSIVLTLAVILGNFTLPVFAYDKGVANFSQVKTQTLSSTNGTILNKLNSVPKSTNALSQNLSIIQKGGTVLGKSQQTEVKKDYVEGEILVKYKNTKINLNTVSGRATALNFIRTKSLEKKEDLVKNNISVLKIKDVKTVEQKIAELKNDPNVEYAQPNYLYYPTAINTNDISRAQLWALENTGQTINGTPDSGGVVAGTPNADINAPEAWAINEGNPVIVAVIDTGVAYNHPDLFNNMWNGSSCVGQDSNGNPISGGCMHGFDFVDNDKIPLPTSDSHGTHVAGTIAAVKNNNKGIIGVAPNAKIMALKVDEPTGGFSTGAIIAAINFAEQNGAKIINASFGGSYEDLAQKNAIASFTGIFVAAAGNCGDINTFLINGCTSQNQTLYPASYDLSNIISVANTDQNDNLNPGSNYSATSVDVGAPGTNILSTVADTPVMSENFEGGTYSMIPGGVTTSRWTFSNDGSSKVAYSDKTLPYASSAFTWLESNPINLSNSNIKGATLGFTIWCDTPPAPNTWKDYIQTTYYNGTWNNGQKYDEDQIHLDGGSAWTDSGHLGYYKNYTEDISAYLSNNFAFTFDWHTDSSVDNNLGCTIDNIKITKFTDGSDEKYDYYEGTSMAAPHVAGLATLIEGYNPNLTSAQVKSIILTTGDLISGPTGLVGKTVSGRRINAYNALLAAAPAIPTNPTTVNLGTAGNYAILAKTKITTTGATSITGDIGISPAAASILEGFSPSLNGSGTFSTSTYVTGRIYAADYTEPTPTALTATVSAMEAAYTDASGRTQDELNRLGGTLPLGTTFTRGIYKWGTNVNITGDITLSGSATDIWIFIITGNLDISVSKKVLLSGGAQAKNVFWVVAGTTTIEPGSTFEGNILGGPGASTIAMQSEAILHGRALGQTDVTLIANTITAPAPSSAKAITVFTIPSQVGSTTINESAETIAVTMPSGTVVTALVPTFTITGASVAVGATPQVSATTPNNFSSPVTFIVTATDGSTQNYIVTVTVAAATTSTISGIIKYYGLDNNGAEKKIPNATVILENGAGEQITTTTTDANGAYQFTDVTNGGDYIVRASKSDNTKGVTSADQTKIGRHIVGLEIFDTVYKKIAGDVNNSGGLTSADQTKIGRFIVGLDNILTSGNWKFYSSNSTPTISNYLNEGLTRNYTNLIADSPNQDFIGVKMGDVNNSWVSN